MASSKCVALLVLVALSSLSAASAVVIGGASSVASYDAYLVSIYPHKASIGAYSSVGSGAGIDGFIARTYAIAASDDPLSAAQSAKSPSHYTLPQVFSTYSFVVNGGTVRLTAAQVYQIYTGRIHLWSQIKGSGKSGTIRPVARSEPTGSGTTEVVTKWLLVQRSGIPANEVGLGPWHTGYKGVAYAKGTGGIVAYVKATPGAIGYAQTGIATAAGLREVALLNHADQYVTASTGEITQALPRVLPPSAGSWAGVSLLNRPGKTTYPIASFVYLFARQGYSGEGPLIIKPFLNFLFSVSAQAAAPKYAFTPLPASIRSKNLAAIAAIHS